MRLYNNTEVSSIVRNAVLNGNVQHAALVYSGYDIIDDKRLMGPEGPMTLQEIFNAEEDVTPGNLCSANLEAHIANTDRVLSSFNFARDFGLYMGVDVNDGGVSNRPYSWLYTAPVYINGLIISIYEKLAVVALSATPDDYFTYNFESYMDEDEEFVAAYATGNTVHLITNKGIEKGRLATQATGETARDRITSASAANYTLSEYASNRILTNAEAGRAESWRFYSGGYAVRNTYELTETQIITQTAYFVGFNVFKGIKPRKQLSDNIDITANDITAYLDGDAKAYIDTDFATAKTRRDMITDILALVNTDTGVQFSQGGTVVNLGSDTYAENPFANYDGFTYRDALKYIAESAGVSVRLSYFNVTMYTNGNVAFQPYLEFRYFADEPNGTIHTGEYYDLQLDEYNVTPVQRVRVQASEDDVGVILPDDPEGSNGLAIIDNPLLIGDSEEEIKAHCTKIYNNLEDTYSGNYRPGSLVMSHDLLMQAGDRVRVQSDLDDSTVTREMLAFTITTTWNGYAECTIESTGQEKRTVLTKRVKESLRNGRRWHEYEVTVDGLKSRMGNAEGDISDLQSTAEALTLRMTNAEGSITSLGVEAGKIVSEVSGLNSSQILRDTRFLNGFGQDGASGVDWEGAKWGRAVGSATADYSIQTISDCPDSRITRAVRLATKANYDVVLYQDKIPVVGGQKYTLSGYFRCDVPATSTETPIFFITQKELPGTQSFSFTEEYTKTDGSWQYFTHLIGMSSSKTGLKIGLEMPNADGHWFEFCGLKLEVGTTATVWSEADDYGLTRVTQTRDALVTEMEDSLGNYYTKSETASKIQTEMTDALGNYYTKIETASEISLYVGNNAYGIKNGVAINTNGVEISSGKHVKIISGSFVCNSGNFSISDSGELTAGSYKLSESGLVYDNGTSSFGITAAKAGTTNLGTALVSNGHIRLVPKSGNNGYFQLYSDSSVLQLLPQPLVGGSGGITKIRQSILGGGAQTDIWDEGYFVDIYYSNLYQQSSREMKTDITPLDISGDVIDALTPVSFRYKTGPDRLHFGLIHEDTLPLLPEICKGDADAEPQKKAVDYSELIAVLLSEVQKLRRRVAALEA